MQENLFATFIETILNFLGISKYEFIKEMNLLLPEIDSSTMWKWFSKSHIPRRHNLEAIQSYFISKFTLLKPIEMEVLQEILHKRIYKSGLSLEKIYEKNPKIFFQNLFQMFLKELTKTQKVNSEICSYESSKRSLNYNNFLYDNPEYKSNSAHEKIKFIMNFTQNYHEIIYVITNAHYNLMALSSTGNVASMCYQVEITSQFLVDRFTKILAELLDNDINVSINLLDLESLKNKDYSQWELTTICHKGNLVINPVECHKVSNYKEFDYILKNKGTFFTSLSHKNEMHQDRYNGKIVAPIKIDLRKKENLSFASARVYYYEILGFVSLDFKYNYDENHANLIDILLELISLFSDELYRYFEKYNFYQLQKSKNMNSCKIPNQIMY